MNPNSYLKDYLESIKDDKDKSVVAYVQKVYEQMSKDLKAKNRNIVYNIREEQLVYTIPSELAPHYNLNFFELKTAFAKEGWSYQTESLGQGSYCWTAHKLVASGDVLNNNIKAAFTHYPKQINTSWFDK